MSLSSRPLYLISTTLDQNICRWISPDCAEGPKDLTAPGVSFSLVRRQFEEGLTIMRHARTAFEIETAGQGFYDFTDRLRDFVGDQAIETGLLTVFLHHTSASLMIQENADPTVQEDFLAFFKRLAPEDGRSYKHGYEGPDDMPAHIKSALTTVHLSIPMAGPISVPGRASTWSALKNV